MAIGNPGAQFIDIIRRLVQQGKTAQLSPAAQQAFARAIQGQAPPQDEAFKAAVQEASAAGLMPKMTAKDWLMVAAVPAAAFGGAALLGAGGAPAAPAVAGGVGIGETGATVGLGGAGATVPAAVAATSGGSSLLHSLLPTIIGAGANVAGTAIAAHGNSEATKAQTEASDKALQVTKDQYALQRQDTAPYRALGQGAVGNLGYLSGIDVDSKVPELSDTVPKQPYGVDASHPAPYVVPGARGADGKQFPGAGMPDPYASGQSLSQLSQPPVQGGMVNVRSPQGTVGQIPASMLQQALQAGGTQV